MGKVLVIAPAGKVRQQLVRGLHQLGHTTDTVTVRNLTPDLLHGVQLVVCSARALLSTPRQHWSFLAAYPQLWILEGLLSPERLRERLASALSRCWGYLSAPFTPAELAAALAPLLAEPNQVSPSVVSGRASGLRVYGCLVDLERRCIHRPDGSCLRLSEMEAALLGYLLEHRQRVISREELLRQVWGIPAEGLTTRTVDMHIARVRAKLRSAVPDAAVPPAILTIRRRGYQVGPAWQCPSCSSLTPALS
jgi:DNA-binding winged helix-turn-helix (wHTH) protein